MHQMSTTQDAQTTFKLNLTCIILSTRAIYFLSNPSGWPCSLYHKFFLIPTFIFLGILVTGYSLGAGISQLVAMDLLRERPNVRCISYGAPLIFAPDIDNPEPDNDAGQHLYTVVCIYSS